MPNPYPAPAPCASAPPVFPVLAAPDRASLRSVAAHQPLCLWQGRTRAARYIRICGGLIEGLCPSGASAIHPRIFSQFGKMTSFFFKYSSVLTASAAFAARRGRDIDKQCKRRRAACRAKRGHAQLAAFCEAKSSDRREGLVLVRHLLSDDAALAWRGLNMGGRHQ